MRIIFEYVSGPERCRKRACIVIDMEHPQNPGASFKTILGKRGTEVIIDDHPESICSRKHASIELMYPQGTFEICDLQSSNGTFVNRTRISRQLLHDGDEVIFGGGQSIPLGTNMSLEQQSNPLVTVWKVKIPDAFPKQLLDTNERPFPAKYLGESKSVTTADVESMPVGQFETTVLMAEYPEDSPLDTPKNTADSNSSDPKTSKNDAQTLSEYSPCHSFDEIMPRKLFASKIGSFVTKGVDKLQFLESAWKWSQLSPNPDQHGQFIQLSVRTSDILAIRYSTSPRSGMEMSDPCPFFINIVVKKAPDCVSTDLFVPSLVQKRMNGCLSSDLAMDIVFFLERGTSVKCLINSIKENYCHFEFSKNMHDMG